MVLPHLAGMSYMMDFEKPSNVSSEDAVMEYEGGFRLVCDPKSLLYLFGECFYITNRTSPICVTLCALALLKEFARPHTSQE